MASLEDDKPLYDIPHYQIQVERPGLTALFDEDAMSNRAHRNATIAEAHRTHRYTLREIGEIVGLSVGMVNQITRAGEGVSK